MRVKNTSQPSTVSTARRIAVAVAVTAGLSGLLGGAITAPDAAAVPGAETTDKPATQKPPAKKATPKPVVKKPVVKKSRPIVRAWASHGRIYMSAINLPEGRKLCGLTVQVAPQYIGSYDPIKQLGDRSTRGRSVTLATQPLPPGNHTVSLRCYSGDDGGTIVASTRHVQIGFIEWAS